MSRMRTRGLRLLPAAAAIAGVIAFAGTVSAAEPTVTFDTTIGPPPATTSFDISFVKNDIGKYVLADRLNNAVDLFDASALTFTGYIGKDGFVGNSTTACSGGGNTCKGPDGVLIDKNNHVWVGDGPASHCTTADCPCFAGEKTSMVKEYTLAPSTGANGRLACLDTGGNFRADEMAFDPRNDLLIVANDADGFLSLIKTSGTPKIVDQFFYADNDVGKPASARGLSTPGGGIEQPVWNPQQGFFYQALPQGTTVGRVDVFNPKPGKLVFLRSIDVPGCVNGPTGLAINNSDELLGMCDNGVALIDANSGKVTILPQSAIIGGGDQIWFDPGSNAWYVSHTAGGQLGVVSNSPGNAIQHITQAGCCGHSVAAFTESNQSFIFNPTATGMGISVFKATP
jgi:DNA-binding beta-propeller fold protein YncE